MSWLKKWIVQRLAVKQIAYDDLVNEMSRAVLELEDEGYLSSEVVYGEDTYYDLADKGRQALRDIDEGRI